MLSADSFLALTKLAWGAHMEPIHELTPIRAGYFHVVFFSLGCCLAHSKFLFAETTVVKYNKRWKNSWLISDCEKSGNSFFFPCVWLHEAKYWQMIKVTWGRRCWIFFCCLVTNFHSISCLNLMYHMSLTSDYTSFPLLKIVAQVYNLRFDR